MSKLQKKIAGFIENEERISKFENQLVELSSDPHPTKYLKVKKKLINAKKKMLHNDHILKTIIVSNYIRDNISVGDTLRQNGYQHLTVNKINKANILVSERSKNFQRKLVYSYDKVFSSHTHLHGINAIEYLKNQTKYLNTEIILKSLLDDEK